jgi:FkbM family methyltransferase
LLGHGDFGRPFITPFRDRILCEVADDRLTSPRTAGLECISSEHFIERYRGRKDIVAINCARFDPGIRHFEVVCLRAGIDLLNPEQAHRALRTPGLDFRLADHLPTIVEHQHRFRVLEDRLDDELSKDTLRRVMLFHLTTNREYYRHVDRPYETIYFRSGLFDVTPEEQYVDCGASIGESITALLASAGYDLRRGWLIEPDKFNVETLKVLLDKIRLLPSGCGERISIHAAAVGDRSDRIRFAHCGGHAGMVLPGATESSAAVQDPVDVVRLDDVIDGQPTLVKMDVEGAELQALAGAAGLIREHKPKLAISAYHRARDLIDLSELVVSLRPDYRLGLRHQGPLRYDTILYFY